MSRKGIAKILNECINETLNEVLGERVAKAVLYHAGEGGLITDVEGFAEALERIFGLGASDLERSILENLYSRVGKEFQVKVGYKFTDYVNEVQRLVVTRRK